MSQLNLTRISNKDELINDNAHISLIEKQIVSQIKFFYVAIFGNTFSGKSSLIKTYEKGQACDLSHATRTGNIDFTLITVTTSYGPVKLMICDISSNTIELRGGKRVFDQYLFRKDAIIFAHRVSISRNTKENLSFEDYLEIAKEIKDEAPVYVAATHCHDEWIFPEEELQEICNENGFPMFKTSIYDIESINSMFTTIANDLVKNYIEQNMKYTCENFPKMHGRVKPMKEQIESNEQKGKFCTIF